MNLSLYILLTPPYVARTPVRPFRPLHRKTPQHPPAIMGPARNGAGGNAAPLQASPCVSSCASSCVGASAPRHLLSVGKLGFAARVVGNAMGLLLMFGGLMLLLQMVRLSLWEL